MTDREAIRRLAVMLQRVDKGAPIGAQIENLLVNLAEPTAPTVGVLDVVRCSRCRSTYQQGTNHDCEPAGTTGIEEWNRGQGKATLNAPAPPVKEGDACRHGTVVNCSCEFGRGYDQARRDMTADSLKAVLHPTVTREQAEWVSDVIQTKWYDIRAKQDDEREAPPVRYEMPAFFRAVADRLEDR